jgi:aminomethyltransferase
MGADRRSPLADVHEAAGARLTSFGGWEMPLSYPAGTVAEHLACRHRVAIFDVSHLGTVRLDAGAFDALQGAFTNDLRKISAGRAQYTHLLGDDGSVLDDIIVWWRPDGTFDVMPNAANTERVREAVGGDDTTGERALLAVQGPNARTVVAAVSEAGAAVRRFRVDEIEIAGAAAVVGGTGYTGEDGVEISIAVDHAADLWARLVAAGAEPAGLGARDTLRLEAGLPLHGHELGPGVTPQQAGLGWVVAWDKGPFRGRGALVEEKERGISRRLRGLRGGGRRPFRDHQQVLVGGKPVGSTTSGGFSPVLERGIALAFLPPEIPVGAPAEVEVRGTALAATVVDTPFVDLPSTP